MTGTIFMWMQSNQAKVKKTSARFMEHILPIKRKTFLLSHHGFQDRGTLLLLCDSQLSPQHHAPTHSLPRAITESHTVALPLKLEQDHQQSWLRKRTWFGSSNFLSCFKCFSFRGRYTCKRIYSAAYRIQNYCSYEIDLVKYLSQAYTQCSCHDVKTYS